MVTDAPRRPRPADVAVAVGCWLVVLRVAAREPEPGRRPTTRRRWCSPSRAAWAGGRPWPPSPARPSLWPGSGPFPRAALIAVAGVPLPLSVAGSADTFSLTSVAIVVAVFLAGLRISVGPAAVQPGGRHDRAGDRRIRQRDAGRRLGSGRRWSAALVQAIGVIGGPLLVAGAIAGRRERPGGRAA